MFDALFQPIKIGPVEIKNRVAVAPMNMMGERDRHPTRQYTCYFNARAVGGFGLMTTGSILTSKEAGDEYPFVPTLYKGSLNFGYYTDFVESIHSMGTEARVFAQLSPGFGRQTGKRGAMSASAVPFKVEELYDGLPKSYLPWTKYHVGCWAEHFNAPREMTVEEIKKALKDFQWAAERAILFGFDGLEIHACHGYGLHQFLSPRTNKRADQYGGSVENRARYVLELIAVCKQSFGDSVPIVVRMSGREYQPDGITPEDTRRTAFLCQEAGADAIDLSNSSGYDDMDHYFCSTRDNVMLLEAQGRKLKEAVKIPIITPGLASPEVAEKAVREGETDLVSLGRQAIADAGWPNKVKEGRLDEIIWCVKDNFCLAMLQAGTGSLRCTQNAEYGKEEYLPQYWPKPMKGRIPPTLRRWKPGLRWQAKSEAWKAFEERRKSKDS
ncbi:MAG: NADH:flavin oxidoreductase [Deltaproteobacteria bacterium]|nr:NADH:flavin oxidoreductase [Deltaproteobacteria bacterium]